MKKYILLNFAYGFNPFLRTLELALCLNEKREQAGAEKYGIIVPWVYGQKQISVIIDELGDRFHRQSGLVFFDRQLGQIINSVFYGEKAFIESLIFLRQHIDHLQKQVNDHLRDGLDVRNLAGDAVRVKKTDIAFSLVRAPRLHFDIEPTFNLSFALSSEVLSAASATGKTAHDRNDLAAAAEYYAAMEEKFTCHYIADPSTFSFCCHQQHRSEKIIMTPPHLGPPRPWTGPDIKDGIFVTVTGIAGLERLYRQAQKMDLIVYTNNPLTVSGAQSASPRILSSGRIKFHFARPGWGSIWLSQMTGVAFVSSPYDKLDDPEMFFNILSLQKKGIGLVFEGQEVNDIIDWTSSYPDKVAVLNGELKKRYGTLNGIEYTALDIMQRLD